MPKLRNPSVLARSPIVSDISPSVNNGRNLKKSRLVRWVRVSTANSTAALVAGSSVEVTRYRLRSFQVRSVRSKYLMCQHITTSPLLLPAFGSECHSITEYVLLRILGLVHRCTDQQDR